MSSASSPVIQVDQLGKRYLLGRDHADSLVDLFNQVLGQLTGGKARQQTKRRQEFWALRDVSFDVHAGEVFGIIGKNGAGKSTLLKLISRVITPSIGQIELTGRVASLLEVGTGFHPDLTGLENVFMNASLLGMSRNEVKQKLDEIVEFAGVKDFLGTPVKRYSSGMRVRLGFAVAAHLEPEILIIDEVLTVGDAEFQKKCLGKMQTVATEGRTVLFVSHNMAAVRSLCTRACFLQDGRLSCVGDTHEIVQAYLAANGQQVGWKKQFRANQRIHFGGTEQVQPVAFFITTDAPNDHGVFSTEQPLEFAFEFIPLKPLKGIRTGIALKNADGVTLFGSNMPMDSVDNTMTGKLCTVRCYLPADILNRGSYSVDIAMDCPALGGETFVDEESIQFEIVDVQGHGTASETLPGVIRPRLRWELHSSSSGN